MEFMLNPKIIKRIYDDYDLFGKVADGLGIKPVSLPQVLGANKPRLTQASILKIIRDHCGYVKDSEILVEKAAPANPRKRIKKHNRVKAA